MGIYLNPTNEGFAESRRSQIYVDKSGIIANLNAVLHTKQKNICISRPRRFGKTMAAEMIAAYYCCGYDSHELFSGLKIESDPSYETHLNKYNVIMLNMVEFLSSARSSQFNHKEYKPEADSLVERVKFLLTKFILDDIKKENPGFMVKINMGLTRILQEAQTVTGKQFVFIIDEWDCMFRETQEDTESQRAYLDFIRDILKDKPYVALAYMTGILPIKKYGRHSALNMFDEFSATRPLQFGEYFGFTSDEVKSLCAARRLTFDEISDWYNGYLSEGVGAVYNPRSVVAALLANKCDSYWTSTETFEALRIYIEMNYDGLRDTVTKLLAGQREKIDASNFTNDMTTFYSKDDVLTLLIHLGYLGYDSENGEIFIPNKEIRNEYVAAMRIGGWDEVIKSVKASDDCLKATLRGDASAVADYVAAVHRETSHLTNNDENALSYIVSLAYYSSRNYYNIIRELPSGDGFADIAFLPKPKYADKPAMIIELKWDKSAETALDQIKRRDYPDVFEGYSGEIILVGINYDKQTKSHECVIERAFP